MALDKEKLLEEIQAFAGIDHNTWKKEALSGGMTRVLVEEILSRRSRRLARKYPFNFLERIYQTASMTQNAFSSSIRYGLISTTGTDVRISSDGFFLEYPEKMFRIPAMRVDDVPVAFMKKSDVLLNKDKYTDTPNAKLAFRDYSDTKGKNRIAFLTTADDLEIELVGYVYPDDIESFPVDFYDYFKDIALLEILKEPRSTNMAAFRTTILAEFAQLEQELIAEYTRDVKIELVHEYNPECNMTYTELSGGYIK